MAGRYLMLLVATPIDTAVGVVRAFDDAHPAACNACPGRPRHAGAERAARRSIPGRGG